MDKVILKQPVRPLIWHCPACNRQNEENLKKDSVTCWYCYNEFETDIQEYQTCCIPVGDDGSLKLSHATSASELPLIKGWTWKKFKLVPVEKEKKYPCPECGTPMDTKVIPVETKTGEVDMDVYICDKCNVEVRGL